MFNLYFEATNFVDGKIPILRISIFIFSYLLIIFLQIYQDIICLKYMCGRTYIQGVLIYIFRILLVHTTGENFRFSVGHFWEFITGHVNIK